MSSAMNPNAALNRVVNDNMLVLLSSELKNSLHRLSAVAGSILEVHTIGFT